MLALLFLLAAAPDVAVYDADPDHAWNRLHAALVPADVDPFDADALLWGVGDANRAQKALSEFLDRQSDARIEGALPRALLQRDLWAAFDAADRREQRHLSSLLAAAIKRIALPRAAIEALPAPADGDGAAAGLFAPESEWVMLHDPGAWDDSITPAHSRATRERSYFSVHVVLPGGREETLAYLARLRRFDRPLVRDQGGEHWSLNPDVPQIPEGTRVALVRRALLVSDRGEPVASPLVESVEMRTYLRIDPFSEFSRPGAFEEYQAPFVAAMDRVGLLRGGAALRVVEPGEPIVNVFRERYHTDARRIDFLSVCAQCHAAAGILSVNTWKRDETGCPTDALSIPRFAMPRVLVEEAHVENVRRLAEFRKREHATFGALMALW